MSLERKYVWKPLECTKLYWFSTKFVLSIVTIWGNVAPNGSHLIRESVSTHWSSIWTPDFTTKVKVFLQFFVWNRPRFDKVKIYMELSPLYPEKEKPHNHNLLNVLKERIELGQTLIIILKIAFTSCTNQYWIMVGITITK